MEKICKQIPLGIDDFKKLRERNTYYVDKSLLIKQVIENGSEVILFTRPRRFGKTLNFSMLKYFFECSELHETELGKKEYQYLFKGLAIDADKEFIEKHYGRYPVINFSFKKIKANCWQDAEYLFKEEISREYNRHRYVLDTVVQPLGSKNRYERIMNMEGQSIEYTAAIADLSRYLFRYYGQQVIVFIDEYDTPLHYAKLNGYYDEMLNIKRALMVDGMKGNDCLEKGIITGIMKLSQESLFSSFNNCEVVALTSKYCADQFGFTEDEVFTMLQYYGLEECKETVGHWYNGYIFGLDTILYNPWSILSFIKSGVQPKAYWINTGDTSLIKKCLQLNQIKGKRVVEKLYQGEPLELEVEENIVYEDVFNDVEQAMSYLLHAGYLKAKRSKKDHEMYCLSIPNYEVKTIYRNILKKWFSIERKTDTLIVELLEHLLSLNMKEFEVALSSLLLTVCSYYDVANVDRQIKMTVKREETEKFENYYHGLLLGLLVNIGDDYYIESNKEYGLGRPDLVIIPKEEKTMGYIMEFKNIYTSSDKTIEEGATEALEQIEKKKYGEGVKKTGVKKLVKIGLGFKGKEMGIKYVVE